MYKFGKRSLANLASTDKRWSHIMHEVIKVVDCSIIEGHRSKERQDYMVQTGRSKVKWPHSKHNESPSKAIDAVPYPIDWNDTDRIRAFAFFVKGVAHSLGYKVRLGADWDGDFTNKDQSFNDLPHMELVD